jgi:hypothetical protein
MTEELEEIFSEEVQRVANSEIEVEQQQRDLMDYPCWIVHGKKEASKLLRLLDICRCEHTDSVKNKELLGHIDYQLQTDDMRFVGIDFTFCTFRSYVHFYKNIMKVIDKTYIINNDSRFIINDDGMIVHCGRLMSDFLRLIMNKKLYEVNELMDEMKEDICNSLSNKLFKRTAIAAACQFIHLSLGHSRSNLSRKFLCMCLQITFTDNLFTHHADHKTDAGINA